MNRRSKRSPCSDIAQMLEALGMGNVVVFEESLLVRAENEEVLITVADNRDRSKGDPRDAHLPLGLWCSIGFMRLPDGCETDPKSRQASRLDLTDAQKFAGIEVSHHERCADLDELRSRLQALLPPLASALARLQDADAVRSEALRHIFDRADGR